MLTRIRTELKINQKVDLQCEGLRKYFSYWLEVCHRKMELQIDDIPYRRLIIVIEGIDSIFEPELGNFPNLDHWLPILPSSVRMIVTYEKGSPCESFFRQNPFIYIHNDYELNSLIL
jgi:hypothetical protein